MITNNIVEVTLGRFDHAFDDAFDARVAQDLISVGDALSLAVPKLGLSRRVRTSPGTSYSFYTTTIPATSVLSKKIKVSVGQPEKVDGYLVSP